MSPTRGGRGCQTPEIAIELDHDCEDWMATEWFFMPDPYGDLRRVTFEALLAEAVMADHMLEGLTRRDSAASVAGLVQKAQETYRGVLERRASVELSREEASLLQDKLDRLQAQLRFFAVNPGGYEA
jgi:hypothetical protein